MLITPRALVSNSLRNFSLHLGTNITYIDKAFFNMIKQAHEFLKMDISDKRTTWPNAQFYINPLNADEDYAGNPIHLVIILISTLYLIPRRSCSIIYSCILFAKMV